MIVILEWLLITVGIVYMSGLFGGLIYAAVLDERAVLSFILGAILMIGSMVGYYLAIIHGELTEIRQQQAKRR